MKKQLLFGYAVALILSASSLQAQTQIGANLVGKAANDIYGTSVAMSGDGTIMAVGAPENDTNGNNAGQVVVYKNINGVWTQIGNPINGEAANDKSGTSIALSENGTILAIGAPDNSNEIGNFAGHVRIYKNVAGTWTQVGADINGEAATNRSGNSVSLSADGSIVAIGAKDAGGAPGLYCGHVRIYENISGTWTQLGADLDGKSTSNAFGTSVSLSADGMVVAIGAPFATGNVAEAGQVTVYQNSNGVWVQRGLVINGESIDYQSGKNVSLSGNGNAVAIGAPYNSSKEGAPYNGGHVRLFQFISGAWTQVVSFEGLFADSLGTCTSISSDGNTVAISAPWNDGINGGSNIGQVLIYKKNDSGNWLKIGSDIFGDANDDFAGKCISLSADGNTVAIGAPGNDTNGSSAGQVRVYSLSATLSSDQFVMEHTSIYPNPVNDELFIQLKEDLNLQEVNIYNSLGQLIKTGKTNQINVSSMAKGFYLVQVVTNKGKATQKVLVN